MTAPADAAAVAARLADLDLDLDLLEVYMRLLLIGPSKASTVARDLGINRADVYRRLNRLAQDGMVSATLTRPARYEAVPPERLFQVLESRFTRRLHQVRHLRAELEPAMLALQQAQGEASRSGSFRVLQGRQVVHDHMVRLVQEARAEVLLVHTQPAALDLAREAALLATRQRAGASMRMVMAPQVGDRLLAEAPERLRFLDLDQEMCFALVDGQEAVLGAVLDPSTRAATAQDVALWTDAPSVVATHRMLFDRLWAEAEPPIGSSAARAAT